MPKLLRMPKTVFIYLIFLLNLWIYGIKCNSIKSVYSHILQKLWLIFSINQWLEPIAASLGEGGESLDKLPVSSQGWHEEAKIHPHSHSHLQAIQNNQLFLPPGLQAFGQWEEHANTTENALIQNQTQELLALRQQC